MTWITDEVDKFSQAHDLHNVLRREIRKRAKGKFSDLIDTDKEFEFIETVLLALLMIQQNRECSDDEEGKRVTMHNKAARIKQAAITLQKELAGLDTRETESDPSQVRIFEGKIYGSGLVSLAKESAARLIDRSDAMLKIHEKKRGAQRKNNDISGVKMIGDAWRECFDADPRGKGTFGSFLNDVFAGLGWDQVAANTLDNWLDSQ